MGLRGPKPKTREVAWGPELAYGIGLMASDGNLSKDGRHLIFVSKDLELIQNVKKCFAVTANANYKASGGYKGSELYYRLQWGDVTLYKFLMSIGITPNKSLTLGKLKVPDKYFFDFLRGHLDGDGSFYSYFDPRWRSSFMFYLVSSSASGAHSMWIRATLKRLCGVEGSVSMSSAAGGVRNLKFAKSETLRILPFVYPRQNVMCLSRKRLKIEKALGIVGQSLNANS